MSQNSDFDRQPRSQPECGSLTSGTRCWTTGCPAESIFSRAGTVASQLPGNGAVDLERYPGPYVGDLRAVEYEPRVVLLGLNPGVGYDSLQSISGLWAQRIAGSGYSYCYCFRRSPEEDPRAWRELHGKRSRYWLRCVLSAQWWLNDQPASVRSELETPGTEGGTRLVRSRGLGRPVVSLLSGVAGRRGCRRRPRRSVGSWRRRAHR